MKRFVLYYLRFFAKVALFLHKPKIIGITGSVGKSSTRNAVFSMMKDDFKVKIVKEGNSETGIPLGILGISPGHYRLFDWLRIILTAPFRLNHIKGMEYLIVEMGIDSPYPPKNMDYLLTIVKPDISVVLNVYPVHTMQFDRLFGKNLDQEKRLEFILKKIAKEKLKIITKGKPKIGIFNKTINFQLSLGQETKLISFGEDDTADIKYIDYQVSLKKTTFKYYLKEENDNLEIVIKNHVLPKGYLEVFAATIAVGKSLGLTNKKITDNLSKNFTIPAGRGSLFQGVNSSIIVDSSYNASRAPTLTFLEMVRELSKRENRPFVFLFGDMRELGQEEKTEHEAVAEKIKELKVDEFYGVGPLILKYVIPRLTGTVRKIKWFKTSPQVGSYLKRALPYRAIVLVKGSQNEIFLEEAVKKLLKNKQDIEKLCRQSDFWLKKKDKYFHGV